MVSLWANPTYGALWRSNRRPIYHRNGRQEKQKLEIRPTNRRSSQHQEIQLRAWERHEWRLRLICDNDTMATRFQQTRKMTGGGPGSSLPHLVLIMSKYGHMSNHFLSLLIPNCLSLTLDCPFVLLPFKFCLSLSSAHSTNELRQFYICRNIWCLSWPALHMYYPVNKLSFPIAMLCVCNDNQTAIDCPLWGGSLPTFFSS